MNCEPCGKSFSGSIPYEQHIQSEKHKKKVQIFGASRGFINIASADFINASLHCDACNISCNSVENFHSHSLTLEHATNVRKIHSGNGDANSSNVTSNINPGNHKADVMEADSSSQCNDDTELILPEVSNSGMNQLSYLNCKTCNKIFSGPEPFKQHYESAAHKKKVDLEKYITNGGQKYITNCGSVQNILSLFTCDICKKQFSGTVPYQQHINSDVHKKKVQTVLLLEKLCGNKESNSITESDSNLDAHFAMTELTKLQDINHPLFCKICNVSCTGLVSYEQHLSGETHRKNLSRAALSEKNVSAYKSGDSVDCSRKLGTSSYKDASQMYVDQILPDAMEKLKVVSIEELKLKEFYPEDKIDFDKFESEVHEDPVDKENVHQESSEEMQTKTEEIKTEVYEICKSCKIELRSKNDALAHFESIEHFVKRWRN